MHEIWMRRVSVGIGLLGLAVSPAFADDLESVRLDLEHALPDQALDRVFASPPLVFRGTPPRGSMIYRERVNGVVLIASTSTVGTGVVVSGQGDIVTNEHVIRHGYKARGDEWVAVWFRPSNGVRPAKSEFLLARIIQSNQRRDLAHIQLAQLMPQTAAVIGIDELRVGRELLFDPGGQRGEETAGRFDSASELGDLPRRTIARSAQDI